MKYYIFRNGTYTDHLISVTDDETLARAYHDRGYEVREGPNTTWNAVNVKPVDWK